MIDQIKNVEEELRIAMMKSDVEVLSKLLSDKLQFVIFDGSVLRKEDDLASHKAKLMTISRLDQTEQKIDLYGESAVVTVRTQVEGTFAGNPLCGTFRYLRVWHRHLSQWQVVAGSISQIVEK